MALSKQHQRPGSNVSPSFVKKNVGATVVT